MAEVPPIRDAWFLTGPTASGKSAVGVELARRLGGEIVCLDSMTIYQRMDVGTAKPSPAARASVPHHLVDTVPPSEAYSLAQYVDRATAAVEAIRKRGRVPLFVGGTPLYLKALLRGIFEGPAADWELRETLATEARRLGTATLHARLEAVDPAAAERLHPNDTRRVIRALEVHARTGQPISQYQKQFDAAAADTSNRVYVLDWPREELRARIDKRVAAMIEEGLVDEVRGLVADFPNLSQTARQAVGYREIMEYLEGEATLGEAVARIKSRTWRLARRQGTWFRSLSECRFVKVEGTLDVSRVVREILASAGD